MKKDIVLILAAALISISSTAVLASPTKQICLKDDSQKPPRCFTRPAFASEVPKPEFTLEKNGSVWALFEWKDAVEYCQKRGERLPTIRELSALQIQLLVEDSSPKAHAWPQDPFWSVTNGPRGRHITLDLDSGKTYAMQDQYWGYAACISK